MRVSFETGFVAVFTVATVVALAARKLKLPYSVALVMAGLLLGASHLLEAPRLTKDLLYAVFLPGLLFESAYAMQLGPLWAERRPILSLALPGVVAVMGITAALVVVPVHALGLVGEFSIGSALVFGVVVSATDPIAVVAIFRRLVVDERLRVIVEGESLLNDGTTVVLFSLVVAAVTDARVGIFGTAFAFVRIVGIGIAVGAVTSVIASRVIGRVEEPMVEMMITTVAAYSSFVAAEQLHSSGVVATVVAGLLCGTAGARSLLSAEGRVAVHVAWEYISFALNSVLFLLIGLQIHVSEILASWKIVAIGFVAVTLGRAVVVLLVTAAFSRTAARLPSRWFLPLTWGGLRGALSMVLVLGLPAEFPHRELLTNMTFGVVLLSIVLQGLSMSTLLNWLEIGSSTKPSR